MNKGGDTFMVCSLFESVVCRLRVLRCKLAGKCGRDSRGAKRWRLAANGARAEPRIARFCEAKAAQILKMHIFGEMYDKYF